MLGRVVGGEYNPPHHPPRPSHRPMDVRAGLRARKPYIWKDDAPEAAMDIYA